MKCPKCGYNSFEFHDSCTKCSSDLSAYKQTYGITPIVLPLEVREKMAEEFRASSAENEPLSENIETHEDMFAFDLPEETAAASSASPFNDDPFNFDDEPAAGGTQQAKQEEDPFADLLETTPQVKSASVATPATAKAAAPASSPGEFDLENFSWDDTPETTTATGEKAEPDDFDSLFGDTSESNNKP